MIRLLFVILSTVLGRSTLTAQKYPRALFVGPQVKFYTRIRSRAIGSECGPAPPNLSYQTQLRAGSGPVPYIIDQATEKDIEQISEACINVFFRYTDNGIALPVQENVAKSISPLKYVQLMYLRLVQRQDLASRIRNTNIQNDMFVAREVIPYSSRSKSNHETEILTLTELEKITNLSALQLTPGDPIRLTRGEVLAFCEVTAKPFGMGPAADPSDAPNLGNDVLKRPVLSNLSVIPRAQKCGLGSTLLLSCENSVLSWTDPIQSEIILQVEQDNLTARSFYEKKGYAVAYADPSCRRFNTQGPWLRSVRTTKVTMKKKLNRTSNIPEKGIVEKFWESFVGALR